VGGEEQENEETHWLNSSSVRLLMSLTPLTTTPKPLSLRRLPTLGGKGSGEVVRVEVATGMRGGRCCWSVVRRKKAWEVKEGRREREEEGGKRRERGASDFD
jgi:hypothetical protein